MEGQRRRTMTDELMEAELREAAEVDDEPRVLTAAYDRAMDAIVLKLTNGRRLLVPREELQGLEDATPEQAAEIRNYAGLALSWPRLDVNHSVPSLLEHRYGNAEWMERLARRRVAA
jgi:hypothetical protein